MKNLTLIWYWELRRMKWAWVWRRKGMYLDVAALVVNEKSSTPHFVLSLLFILKIIGRRSSTKTIVVFIQCYYKISIMWHSKTVPYDRLRFCNVNINYNFVNYKNATAWHSKAILQNLLRLCIVEICFSSSDGLHNFTCRTIGILC